MTTFEPGASEVFTHGIRSRPASTAFFASRPAPTITDGFDVFVQLVIAAMTTDPCPKPSSRSATAVPGSGWLCSTCFGDWPPPSVVGGSLAGNDSAAASSYPVSASPPVYSSSSERKSSAALESATRSCGRFGPASEGSTSPRSSSSASE